MPRSFALLGVLALTASACTAHRLALPQDPTPAHALEGDRAGPEVVLRGFHVTNQSPADVEAGDGPERLAELFLRHLATTSSTARPRLARAEDLRPELAVIETTTTATRTTPRLEVEVFVRVEDTDQRTYLFDALFFYPGLGLFPFTPEWGDAIVRAEMKVRRAGRIERTVRTSVAAPYSAVFYSWYRTAPREDAFRRAHDFTLAALARRLFEPTLDDEAPARLEAAPAPETHGEPVWLPPEGAGVVFRPPARRGDSLLGRYLAHLGGLELGVTRGRANVRSRAVTERGWRETVGSGRALSSGYRISLFKPPEVTGFFFPPIFGFFSQSIDIRGFRDDVPLFVPEGTFAIPAVASDPATGAPVDLTEPIAYGLRLRSGYIGQAAGLNLVLGDESFQVFSTLGAGLNLLEVRHTRVRFNGKTTAGMSLAALRSGHLTGDLGFAIPALHLAVRASVRLEWYAAFDFPERLEFLARAAYQPDKEIFERERTFVEGASLHTVDGLISAVVLF